MTIMKFVLNVFLSQMMLISSGQNKMNERSLGLSIQVPPGDKLKMLAEDTPDLTYLGYDHRTQTLQVKYFQ